MKHLGGHLPLIRSIKGRSCNNTGKYWTIPRTSEALLESGVDIRYIQELLGHYSAKTTEIYTHARKQGLAKIESPL